MELQNLWLPSGKRASLFTRLPNCLLSSIIHMFPDRVFGPTTTTRHVYDVAAQHVVGGAMEGISGPTLRPEIWQKMTIGQGDQRSPGIIPLAVKDAFSIIQEVVNDLLNPAGQNLRIREDAQGTFVEGIKEEVVLSPAHALSLIAAGEEHRHVGSTNFNLLSSRSHTIFTLTVESSPCGETSEGEAVNLSQLNLIDLAGSESSKAETTGVRRKEGSYINKSLLTLGTIFRMCQLVTMQVISKLTDGRASHVPYRDSKLTRLLQSSLSGHGRVSLICTVTPSSSSSEETHNTLKFAHRAKHIEIQAAQNKIIDEKSLIKKYQNEIRCLKEELEQLKRGIVTVPQLKHTGGDDIVLLKQKLAYLPHRRRDLILDDENIDMYVSLDGNAEVADDTLKEERKTRKHGLLNWLKLRKRESGVGTLTSTSDKSSGAKSISTPSTPQAESVNFHTESRHSHSLPTETTPSADLISEARQDRESPEDNFSLQETPLVEIAKLNDEIKMKNEQITLLETQIADSIIASHDKVDKFEALQVKAADNRIIQEQLNQKIYECEGLKETVASLKEQLSDALDLGNFSPLIGHSQHYSASKSIRRERRLEKEDTALKDTKEGLLFHAKETEIEELKHRVNELTESKEQLELRNKKLADESSYAKGLASAAAVELKALSEEVAKLMNHNERLAAELAAQKNSPTQRRTNGTVRNGRREGGLNKRQDQGALQSDFKRELALSREREHSYEAALAEKDQIEADLQRTVEESKQREAYLENELANMWVLVAKLKKSQGAEPQASESPRESQRVENFKLRNNTGLSTGFE
ncbi:hypothetical protein RJ639_004113 [Escallonia herrerae]|uniref:Kinesin-like protein n=1 Tax=Escallonia herrerae TaxID=1293975 RepID=A0AA88W0X9_9ASTE|nr:hypothetical protein RJ639_004113 [Escallonia herrerae]